jgi:membrane fusion protein (multidrug efflux system)
MSNPAPEIQSSSNRQKVLLIRVTLIFLILGLLWFIYWSIFSRHYEYTDNAYVNGNIIPVTAQVAGTIISVEVNDTQYVKEGTTLVLLDEVDRKIALEQAKATLALVLRQTAQLYVKDKGLQATIDARQLNVKQASSDLKRRQQAIHIGGISQEELTHAQDNFNIANSLLTTALSEREANKVLISGTSIKMHPNVLQAIAGVRRAYLEFMRTTIKAPVSGYVSKRSAQVGQLIAPGTYLMAVVPLKDVWVDANFKEKQLQKIKTGQSVILKADIYGSSVIYHGRVAGFSGGTGSAFSLLPAQNATGNWIKVVQRLPVRIILDPKELQEHPLRIGLSMEVTVDTNSKPGTVNQISINSDNHTTIFNQLDKGAESVIRTIFKENLGKKEESNQLLNNSSGLIPDGK